MPVIQGIFFAIQLGVTKLLETTEPNSFSSTDNRHHVKRRSFMSVIVNDELNGLVVDYQINAVHEVSLKKGGKVWQFSDASLSSKSSTILKNLAQKGPNNATTSVILRLFSALLHKLPDNLLW